MKTNAARVIADLVKTQAGPDLPGRRRAGLRFHPLSAAETLSAEGEKDILTERIRGSTVPRQQSSDLHVARQW
jgi:hypothetical protein